MTKPKVVRHRSNSGPRVWYDSLDSPELCFFRLIVVMDLSGTAALFFPLGVSANGLRFVPGLASLLRDYRSRRGVSCWGFCGCGDERKVFDPGVPSRQKFRGANFVLLSRPEI